MTATLFAAGPASQTEKFDVHLALDSFGKDLWNLPREGWNEAKRTYTDWNNLALLLMAGGGSIALHDSADERLAGHFERHGNIPADLDKFTDLAGNPGIHFAFTGLWYAMAAGRGDEFNKDRSWTMFKALSITGATTLLLKGIVHNHTPNDKEWAWPSGHTASSFCVASVLHEFYGPWVGAAAYAGAGFVGYRMMDSGDHWASDVLFGAVLGYVVGHSVAGEHKRLEIGGFEVMPLIYTANAENMTGLGLLKSF